VSSLIRIFRSKSSRAIYGRALYEQAGLSLDDDLELLNKSARIAANPASFAYLAQNISFDGKINIPVLTMHTKGDGLVVLEDEQSYARVVREAGNDKLLRQVLVHRAGHCTVHSGGNHCDPPGIVELPQHRPPGRALIRMI